MSALELRYNCSAETPTLCLSLEDKMLKTTMLTQAQLKNALHYDKDTGIFTWNKTKSGVTRGSRVAGSISKTHLSITINGNRYLAHRLAWLYEYGEFPLMQIDHINGEGRDNSLLNLRLVTTTGNAKNQKLPKNNKHGHMGIYINNNSGKAWKASITNNGKMIHLGYFNTKEEAIVARQDAETKFGYHENHGRCT